MEVLIRKFDNPEYEEARKTAEEMDEMRHRTLAYEYLCHLEEAKLWIEVCLKEKLPSTTELEENLRNGVYLAKLGHFIAPDILPMNKIYDVDQKRYKIAGLQFRHTDNINFWLKVLKTTGLPMTFQPETTDVYDKKNMPRVIYCIHALSTHMFKLGKAPLIQDLYGKAKFTDEEIDAMSKELKRYGIAMPAFQKIGGILSSNIEGDAAALHAAVININQLIDSNECIEAALLNQTVKLKHVIPGLEPKYREVLIRAKQVKIQNTLNRSMNDSYVADVYDELLTQAEIQGYINNVNIAYTWEKIMESIKDDNDKSFMHHLKSEWLQLKNLQSDNVKYYTEQITADMKEFDVTNVLIFCQELQMIVNKGNSFANKHFEIEKAVVDINKSLSLDNSIFLYNAIQDLSKHSNVTVDMYSLPLMYEELKLDQLEYGANLEYNDLVKCIRTVNDTAKISRMADQGNNEELWVALKAANIPIDNLRDELSVFYCQTMILARQAKSHADLGCSLLTISDIQDCVDEVNSHEDSTQNLIEILGQLNMAIKQNDLSKLISLLEDERLGLKGLVYPESDVLYMKYLKTASKKKGDGELWMEDIKCIIQEVAQETKQVEKMCSILTKINLALLQMDCDKFFKALYDADLKVLDDRENNEKLFVSFIETFEHKNSSSHCPWVVYHTNSSKTVYINIETNCYSWDTPKNFNPHSKFLSIKDIHSVLRKTNRNNIENMKKRELEIVIKLQARIRGFLVRKHLQETINFYRSVTHEIIKIQSWWRGVVTRKMYTNELENLRAARKSLSCRTQDKEAYYRSQVKKIVKIQAIWRGRCARRAFYSLFRTKNPPFKIVKYFVPLLDFSTEDYEKEIYLQTLRAEAVQAIRKNQQLSKQLDELDLKIGLLVQNRISLQDVVHHKTKIEDLVKKNSTLSLEMMKPNDSRTANVKTMLSTSTRGLKALTRESRQLLDGYQHLFYTLQTNPKYLSKLLFCLPQSRTNQFVQNVIFTLFNFGSNARDEYLLMKLFRCSLEEEINLKFSKPAEVITGNPIILKMAVNHAREMSGLTNLRNIVGPLVEKMINDRNLSIDTSPVDIYKTWRNRMESQSGLVSNLPYTVTVEEALNYNEVKARLNHGLQILKSTVLAFLDRITACKDMLPFSILYMAKVLHYSLLKKFPHAPEKETLKVIGHLIYYQFVNAAIVAPDAFNIITLPPDQTLSNDQRRNLASVAKILHFAASKKGFGEESAHLQCLNPFIIECHEKMKLFFKQCCQGPSLEEYFSVDEYSEATLLYKPVIYISVQEICDTHSLLVEYEDYIAPEASDPLHELLDALGPTEPDQVMPLATLVPQINTDVCLTLVDKYQLPADDMTDVNKLFIKTKELCVTVLPFLNGEHLLEALCIGTTKQQQNLYEAYVKQKLYSGMIKPNENMTLREHIALLRKYLNRLEDEGYVTREDGYQSIVTAIALDLCNKGKYRREQLKALQNMKRTKDSLDQKTKYYQEQCDYYNQYINKCLENLNAGKRTVHSLDRKGYKVPGKLKSKIAVKYSAQKLREKGVLIEIDGLSPSQYKNVMFEINPLEHSGVFNVKGKFLGVDVEKIDIDIQHLLQLQYDGCTIIDLFGKAKLNVNLLLFILNKKFYGKT